MKKPKPPSIVFVSVMTAVTVVVWVGFEVYRSFTKTQPASVAQDILKDLNAQLNPTVLEEIDQRVYFELGDTQSFALRLPPNVELSEETLEVFEQQENEQESTNSAEFAQEQTQPANEQTATNSQEIAQ